MKLPSRPLPGGGASYKLPTSLCPGCGRAWDGAGALDNPRQPEPGDVGVCLGCAAVNIYGDDLRLRQATEADLASFDPDLLAYVRRAQRAATTAIALAIVETGEPPRGKPGEGRA